MNSAASRGANESEISRTLRAGFASLRFTPELEREFLAEHRAANRVRIRISVCLALMTTIGFALMDRWLIRGQAQGLPDAIRFGIQLPIVITCLVLTSKRYFRWYWPAIHVFAPLFGIGTVIMAANSADSAVALLSARLVLAAFFFYFMLGMSFYAALRTNMIMLAAYAIAAIVTTIPPQVSVYELFILVCANLFAGAGCYSLEHANLLAFLDRRLLTEVATHDGLTGLTNRAAFETDVRKVWKQAIRDGASVTVLMIDIDCFKAFNDRYGHQAGDECLREVARAVRRVAQSRPFDIVARYGGEEMIAVLAGADRAHAVKLAQALLDSVAALRLPHAASVVKPHVTISIGVVTVEPGLDSSYDFAVRIADRALYSAKNEGRDRYVAVDARHLAAADAEAEPSAPLVDQARIVG